MFLIKIKDLVVIIRGVEVVENWDVNKDM